MNEELAWTHTFVYEANKGMDRKLLWNHLKTIKGIIQSSPWLLSGDFNSVLNAKEKWGREKINSYDADFKVCLNDIKVSDLPFSGCFFTWSNKREAAGFIARKLVEF